MYGYFEEIKFMDICSEHTKGPIRLGPGPTRAPEAGGIIRWIRPKSHWIMVWPSLGQLSLRGQK
jgi:hypothetical protein